MEYKILKTKHFKDCCISDEPEWLFERKYRGNWNGKENAKQGLNYSWFEFRCNDPDCLAKMIAREDYISDVLNT